MYLIGKISWDNPQYFMHDSEKKSKDWCNDVYLLVKELKRCDVNGPLRGINQVPDLIET